MSLKEKIYIAISFVLIIGLCLADFVLFRYYWQLKNSPQSQINAQDVYDAYTEGLK